jgi:hypothetical protein
LRAVQQQQRRRAVRAGDDDEGIAVAGRYVQLLIRLRPETEESAIMLRNLLRTLFGLVVVLQYRYSSSAATSLNMDAAAGRLPITMIFILARAAS